MLSIVGGAGKDGVPRRQFLRVGTAAIGGLTLFDLMAARSAAELTGVVKDKSVIVLNL